MTAIEINPLWIEIGGPALLAGLVIGILITWLVARSRRSRLETEINFLDDKIKNQEAIQSERDAAFREQWLADLVHDGHKDGMLNDEERDAILERVRDPFIVKYLKCVAVHFATLPVTQVVSVIVGAVIAGYVLAKGGTWKSASAWFAGTLVFFQIIPILDRWL